MDGPIYLDNHATTRTDPRVVDAMVPYFSEVYGNAASKSHPFGWRAQEAVDTARAQVAAAIGARPEEIVFTSGATESTNLALFGAADARRARGAHLVTAQCEHKATLDACIVLEQRGASITRLAPRKDGTLDHDTVAASLRDDTVLLSLMHVNNEIGTVHNLAALGAMTRPADIWFHADLAQSLGRVRIDVDEMNLDLASLSAHKVYGPKGAGALFVRRRPRVRPTPLLFGGGHERGLRSGTLNVPGVVGFGQACALAVADLDEETARLQALRDRLLDQLRAGFADLVVHGSMTDRVAGNLNLGLPGVEAERLLLKVQRELALSTGSACTSMDIEPSHVLRAIGVPHDLAHCSIRIGLGRFNTADDIDQAAAVLIAAGQALKETA